MKKIIALLLAVLCLCGCQLSDPVQESTALQVQMELRGHTYADYTEVGIQTEDTAAGEDGPVSEEFHSHGPAAEPQTMADPITGYCGNTRTTLYIGDKEYSFMGGCSVALTDILVNLEYDPMRVCRCRPEYTVDTEFVLGYGIHLTNGYARCEKGQAELTQEQIDTIAQIIQWAETTNCEYPINP